jgi:hypothetical protein
VPTSRSSEVMFSSRLIISVISGDGVSWAKTPEIKVRPKREMIRIIENLTKYVIYLD